MIKIKLKKNWVLEKVRIEHLTVGSIFMDNTTEEIYILTNTTPYSRGGNSCEFYLDCVNLETGEHKDYSCGTVVCYLPYVKVVVK